ncbi:hypothetical protein N431DRAFT_421835 [Stipitochalara longipes BDJ]|nr:hypothetical protein N431DRAFT_421835 [Stipitochalara longipes BDJ]
MDSKSVLEMDYRSRFKDFIVLEEQRKELVEEILIKLDAVEAQLDTVVKDSAREVSILKADLESEKEARRGWQDKAGTLRERISSMEQARYVLVLIDADADSYLFHEKYLSRGLSGGQAAADQFLEKVREHLVSLGAAINDPKTVPVVVKAYANLSGLAQACVRDRKLSCVGDMSQFWVGFTRRHPMVDFVDVGTGKEEADNKLKTEVLSFHIGNPQCEHILLACCHDAGYVPELREYAAQSSSSERITLLLAGHIRSDMSALGFRATRLFEPLFSPSNPTSNAQAVPNGKVHQLSVSNIQQTLDRITAIASSQGKEKPVKNCGRLRPILRNGVGKRIDKDLKVNPRVLQEMRERNLCSWHYLRSDCQKRSSCERSHNYPRPLCAEEYDAQWLIARHGACYTQRKRGNCEDDQCMYGHIST